MNVLAEFKKVTTFIFDIDGVLTDGTVLVLRDGLQARQMHGRFGPQGALGGKDGAPNTVTVFRGGEAHVWSP